MFRFAQSIPLSTSVNSSSSGSGSGNGNGNGSSTTPQSSSSGASSSSTSTSTSTAPTQTSSSLSGPTKSLSMVMLLAAVGTVVSIVVTWYVGGGCLLVHLLTGYYYGYSSRSYTYSFTRLKGRVRHVPLTQLTLGIHRCLLITTLTNKDLSSLHIQYWVVW